jgi:hypothetical protein
LTHEAFQRPVFEDPERRWELLHGQLREKPGTTARHNQAQHRLVSQLYPQLDHNAFEIRLNSTRLRRGQATLLIPDTLVVPSA